MISIELDVYKRQVSFCFNDSTTPSPILTVSLSFFVQPLSRLTTAIAIFPVLPYVHDFLHIAVHPRNAHGTVCYLPGVSTALAPSSFKTPEHSPL